METKEIKITPPEGYEIDKENSTFDCIKFKPIEKRRWRDDKNALISGYWIVSTGAIMKCAEIKNTCWNVFASEKQAKSALAMARISQIMANDERFGGVITDKEWDNNKLKCGIYRFSNNLRIDAWKNFVQILMFHTREQAELFLLENEDLVRDYYMLD